MSAPDTNTRKQSEKHRGPLTGMFAVVLFALVLLVGLVLYVSNRAGAPEGAATQTTGTGAEATDGVTATSQEAAPLVQPEETTGADASANESADTNPSDSQVSTPPGQEPGAAPSADD